MKKNLGKQTLVFPMPVFMIATYDENGKPDVMNAAWGGIHDTNQIGICISPEHKTAKNILLKKSFTVSMADEKHIKQCDFVGIVSANDDDKKIEKSGFSFTKSEFIDAPIINELGMCLECELVSYDEKTGCTVANIINIKVDENVLTNDKIDIEKLNPICFDGSVGNYVKMNGFVAKAFSVGSELK